MNQSNMAPENEPSEFQEEWLSAYLDGELPPHQVAIVEQRLQADSEAQRMLLDLQRVRKLIGDLPKWTTETFSAADLASSETRTVDPRDADSVRSELTQHLNEIVEGSLQVEAPQVPTGTENKQADDDPTTNNSPSSLAKAPDFNAEDNPAISADESQKLGQQRTQTHSSDAHPPEPGTASDPGETHTAVKRTAAEQQDTEGCEESLETGHGIDQEDKGHSEAIGSSPIDDDDREVSGEVSPDFGTQEQESSQENSLQEQGSTSDGSKDTHSGEQDPPADEPVQVLETATSFPPSAQLSSSEPSPPALSSSELSSSELSALEPKPSSSRRSSIQAWLRPLAIAASLVLMAGIGYLLWPNNVATTSDVAWRSNSSGADDAKDFESDSAFEPPPSDQPPSTLSEEAKSSQRSQTTQPESAPSSQPLTDLPPPREAFTAPRAAAPRAAAPRNAAPSAGISNDSSPEPRSRASTMPEAASAMASSKAAPSFESANTGGGIQLDAAPAVELLPSERGRPSEKLAKGSRPATATTKEDVALDQDALPAIQALEQITPDSELEVRQQPPLANSVQDLSNAYDLFIVADERWSEDELSTGVKRVLPLLGGPPQTLQDSDENPPTGDSRDQMQTGFGGDSADLPVLVVSVTTELPRQQLFDKLIPLHSSFVELHRSKSSGSQAENASRTRSNTSNPSGSGQTVPGRAEEPRVTPAEPILLLTSRALAELVVDSPVLSDASPAKPSVFWMIGSGRSKTSIASTDKVLLLLNVTQRK